MGSGRKVSGRLHRNDWFHDWLVENEIGDASEAYKAARNSGVLADLIDRAQTQQTAPIERLNGRSIVAGRSLDLTSYLACGHPDCITRQVDDLFSRVWHYFDKIAISGPDAHFFLEAIATESPEKAAKRVARLAQPVFHIRDIGADGLVTWVSKPPACRVHWAEFEQFENYQIPDELVREIALRLLSEGTVRFQKRGSKAGLILSHPELFSGGTWRPLEDVHRWKKGNESPESSLARRVVEQHWIGAASDTYTANSMNLPLGLGVALEARMTGLQHNTPSPSEVAFNLVLPVVDGLPVKELLALRETESDAFEGFRDSLTQAIKTKLATVDAETEDIEDLASEIRADVIDPALHQIQRRLRAAEGVLRRNHRYNIAIAGLATICGIYTSPDITATVAVAAMVGTATVESKFTSEKRDIALEDMYFLWKAKEYAKSKSATSQRSKRRRKR